MRKRFASAWVATPASAIRACENSLQAVFVPVWLIRVTSAVQYRGGVAVVNPSGQQSWRTVLDELPLQEHEVTVPALDPASANRVPEGITEAAVMAAGPWAIRSATPVASAALSDVATVLPFATSAEASWDTQGRAKLESLLQLRIEGVLAARSSTGEVENLTITYQHGIPRGIPVLLPVWVASFREEGENGAVHTFIVNGFSGNTTGDVPVSIPTVGTPSALLFCSSQSFANAGRS